jgi:hypothetical protein
MSDGVWFIIITVGVTAIAILLMWPIQWLARRFIPCEKCGGRFDHEPVNGKYVSLKSTCRECGNTRYG